MAVPPLTNPDAYRANDTNVWFFPDTTGSAWDSTDDTSWRTTNDVYRILRVHKYDPNDESAEIPTTVLGDDFDSSEAGTRKRDLSLEITGTAKKQNGELIVNRDIGYIRVIGNNGLDIKLGRMQCFSNTPSGAVNSAMTTTLKFKPIRA